VPPAPAVPPVPPSGNPGERGEKLPKVPVTYLGVETSELPSVVADQLGLAKGFGLVVDYVVPDGPAAAAGVQQNDILRMFNDQILMEPDQLSKLIRSMPEGTTVTLTVLRKGTETKLTAQLGKREVPQRRGGSHRHWHGGNFGNIGPNIEKLTEELTEGLSEELGKMQFVDGQKISEEVRQAQREVERAAREIQREASREAREAQREARQAAREAAREARRQSRGFRFSYGDDGRLKTTRIDMDKAQIVYHDGQGELKIENVSGKKVLTAKDPQGRLVFSGPVETPDELGKLPPEVKQRYDQLEQKDLPAIAPSINGQEKTVGPTNADDNDNDNDSDEQRTDVLQIARPDASGFPYRRVGINTILI
jgi:uncharacterized membrane protein